MLMVNSFHSTFIRLWTIGGSIVDIIVSFRYVNWVLMAAVFLDL